MKKHLAAYLLIGLAFCACSPKEQSIDNTFYYVTRLGSDTLAIERVEKQENSLRADVVLRSPRISLTSYGISWDTNNKLKSLTAIAYEGLFGEFPVGGSVKQNIEAEGDSLVSESEGRNGMVRSSMLNDNTYLPFIDMVHWPYDIAFNRAHLSAEDSIHQYLLTGRRASDFIIHRTADNEYTLRHPSRGYMYVQTDNKGNMTWLDAKETTRKLIVERVSDLDFEMLTEKYIEIDKKALRLAHLVRLKRWKLALADPTSKLLLVRLKERRTIFGGIVPYGEHWRTGANSASHFSTTKDIYIAGNKVPAGEYTLFSIPEENGGTLIINKQTGQNGQSYDESRDLMRVPMMREENSEEVEGFTIQVVETENGGSIELLWDRTIYYVNFNFE